MDTVRVGVFGPVLPQDLPICEKNGRPVVRLERYPPGTDERDILEVGSPGAPSPDVLVTRNPATLAYATSSDHFTTVPLPWDLSYLLVVSRAEDIDQQPPGLRSTPIEFRARLAQDAVRADARGWEGPAWWEQDVECIARMASTGFSRGNPEIAYPEGDPTARELAERFVVVVRDPSNYPWLTSALAGLVRAVPLSPARLEQSIQVGAALGYVVPVSRQPTIGCAGHPRWSVSSTIFPLVDTRAHAIVRKP